MLWLAMSSHWVEVLFMTGTTDVILLSSPLLYMHMLVVTVPHRRGRAYIYTAAVFPPKGGRGV